MGNYWAFINFFLLSSGVLVLYYLVQRLRYELKIVKELRSQSKQYKDLIDRSSEGVFYVNKKGEFVIINDAGARILGCESAQDLLDRKVNVRNILLNLKEYFTKEYQEKLFSGGINEEQIKMTINGEDVIVVECNIIPKFDTNGRLIGVEGNFHDVTKRVEMQNQLREYSEQLEHMVQIKTSLNINLEREKFDLEKLAAIGQASSTIVHEIRTPLTSIKMGLSTLLSRVSFSENDERLIQIANSEIKQLEKMLHEILDYSKPQYLNCTSQDIHQILRHACSQFEEIFHDSNVTCQTQLNSNESMAFVDLDKITQVFSNIILNALQAMNKGGYLNIISSLHENQSILINFTDTGHGIAKENLNKIFDPFFSNKASGTGLGLPLVQKIVHGHNGSVYVESKVNEGTTVSVVLPLNRSHN